MAPGWAVFTLLGAGLLSGCFFWQANVDLGTYPHRARSLPAAGIHDLTFSVKAVDQREVAAPRDVGVRRGTILHQPRVVSSEDPERIVRKGVVHELRLHDLRVVREGQSVVHLRVRLLALFVNADQGPVFLNMEGGGVRAFIEGEVDILDGQTGRLVATVPVVADGDASSMLLSARYYEYALNAALTEFSARVVRHPDTLIAVQSLHPKYRRAQP